MIHYVKICTVCGYAVVPIHTPSFKEGEDWEFVAFQCMNCEKEYTEEEMKELSSAPGGYQLVP